MTEEDSGIKTDSINAPPSIEINAPQLVTTQPVMLTDGVEQIQGTGINLMQDQPQNVKFVMGPDGQIMAIEKPPFIRKHFYIGGGIPFALYFIPILLLLFLNPNNFEGIYYNEEIVLTMEEGTTNYTGTFQLDNDVYLNHCWIELPGVDDESDYYSCYVYSGDQIEASFEFSNDSGTYNSNDSGTYNVGEWERNGDIRFDNGTNFGSEIIISIETQDYTDWEMYDDVGAISSLTCCLGFLLSIVMLIVGFSTGKPGMGWGGLTSLLLFPVVGILSWEYIW